MAPNSIAQLIGRSCLAALFLVSGIGKIVGPAGTIAYMSQKGLPFPEPLLVATILLEVGGSILLIIGWHTRIAALLLAAFTMAAALIFHDFWAAQAAMHSNQLAHFLKNVAVAGGLLLLAAGGPGPISLDHRRG